MELSKRQTEHAIKLIKDTFQQLLASSLHLRRVTAPLFVKADLGINDTLNGEKIWISNNGVYLAKKVEPKYFIETIYG